MPTAPPPVEKSGARHHEAQYLRSSIRSTSFRYTLLSKGEITPPCGTPRHAAPSQGRQRPETAVGRSAIAFMAAFADGASGSTSRGPLR